jgi:hypothetical protein
MPTALAVLVLGLGIGALGLVEDDLYVVGIIVVVIGGVGVLVRLVDGWRDRRAARQSLHDGGRR